MIVSLGHEGKEGAEKQEAEMTYCGKLLVAVVAMTLVPAFEMTMRNA